MAESASRKSGSAISAPKAGTASRRISRVLLTAFYGGGGLVGHRASLTGSTGVPPGVATDFVTPRVMTKDTKHDN